MKEEVKICNQVRVEGEMKRGIRRKKLIHWERDQLDCGRRLINELKSPNEPNFDGKREEEKSRRSMRPT